MLIFEIGDLAVVCGTDASGNHWDGAGKVVKIDNRDVFNAFPYLVELAGVTQDEWPWLNGSALVRVDSFEDVVFSTPPLPTPPAFSSLEEAEAWLEAHAP